MTRMGTLKPDSSRDRSKLLVVVLPVILPFFVEFLRGSVYKRRDSLRLPRNPEVR